MRRKRRTGLFWTILAVFLALGGIAIWLLLTDTAIRRSPEFASQILHYVFVNKEKEVGYFIRIDTSKRMIYIISLKQHSFDPVNNRAVDLSNPLDVFSFVEKMLDISTNQRFYASLTDKQMKDFMNLFVRNGHTDFGVFLGNLAQKKSNIFDNVLLGRRLSVLRPESNFTKAALAKFVYEFQRNALRPYNLVATIDKPIRITVDGRQYERIYLDLKSIETIKQDIKR